MRQAITGGAGYSKNDLAVAGSFLQFGK